VKPLIRDDTLLAVWAADRLLKLADSLRSSTFSGGM
jgi:hypothetical protein